MSTASGHKSSIVNFQGKSGAWYSFQAWPMGTRFKPVGGIYIVSKRECLDRTFSTMAAHRCLAIGHTANLAAAVLTEAELRQLIKQGANCICVHAATDEARRVEIEKDLRERNEQRGGQLHYLFRVDVPERAPAISDKPRNPPTG